MNFDLVWGAAVRAAIGPEAAVYALVAMGLNIHYGYTGLLNFGHVGYMLVGTYGVAITVNTFGGTMWMGVGVALAMSVVLSLILGLPTLRLRGDYFAIVTIAAAEILRFLTRSTVATDVTGGVFGIRGFAREFNALNPLPVGRYGLGPASLTHLRLWSALVTWALVALAVLLVWSLMRAPWGRVLRSIREDEDAARSLGKNVFSYKMQSLVLGGLLGTMGGVMFGISEQAAHPDTFLPILTFYAYAIVILGGPARVAGPILGSMIFWFVIAGTDAFLRESSRAGMLPTFLAQVEAIGAIRFALVGAMLMALMAFRPQGILGDRREMQLGN